MATQQVLVQFQKKTDKTQKKEGATMAKADKTHTNKHPATHTRKGVVYNVKDSAEHNRYLLLVGPSNKEWWCDTTLPEEKRSRVEKTANGWVGMRGRIPDEPVAAYGTAEKKTVDGGTKRTGKTVTFTPSALELVRTYARTAKRVAKNPDVKEVVASADLVISGLVMDSFPALITDLEKKLPRSRAGRLPKNRDQKLLDYLDGLLRMGITLPADLAAQRDAAMERLAGGSDESEEEEDENS